MSDLWSRLPLWAIARRSTAFGFLALLVLGSRGGPELPEWLGWLVGSTSASTAFGLVPFVDPLAALEATLTTRAWMPTVWLGAASLMLAAVLLGPVFCGWLCPLGLLLDLVHSGRARLEHLAARHHLRLPTFTLPRRTRLLLLGLALGFSVLGRIPIFQALSPIHALSRAAVFAADGVLLFVAAIALVEFLAAPRLWCRTLCPLGALYSLLGSRALLRIRVDQDIRKSGCQRCNQTCPMGIRVMEDYSLTGKSSIDDPNCTRCGACVDACPREILSMCPRAGG